MSVEPRARRRRMEYRTVPERLLTADDLLHMEDDGWHTELVQGRLVREPPPGAEHGSVAMELGARLAAHARSRGLGRVFAAETGFRLFTAPDTVRGPDVSFVSADRIPPEGLPQGYLPFAPDLAVEVVSPSNTAREVTRKVLEYLTAGTRLVWVVDPSSRAVTVYPGLERIRILTAADELDGADVVPGFRVRVGELFV